jgi:DNA polymerase delta subunit 3
MQLDEQAPPSSVPSFLLSQSDQQAPESTPEILEEDEVQTTTILLVKEEELEKAHSEFESILKVEMYSLEPSSPKDVHQLTVANEIMYTARLAEDRKEASQTYGVIWNEGVKTRKLESVTSTTGGNPKPSASASIPALKKEDSKSSVGASKPKPTSSGGALLSSFAKSKPPKPKEVKKEETKDGTSDLILVLILTSIQATMKDVFDEDEDSDDQEPVAPMKPDPAVAVAAKKAREGRQAALRAMMDEESDSANDSPAQTQPPSKPAQKKSRVVSDDEDEEMDDAPDSPIEDDTAATALDKSTAKDAKADEETIQPTGDGRRRGRRRVIKKKHYQDEKGYFVSKEVEEWESFSEADEPKPAAKTSGPAKQLQKASAGASKKGAAGGAKKEGNIMSFFGKKA